jgi:hypothetical protein
MLVCADILLFVTQYIGVQLLMLTLMEWFFFVALETLLDQYDKPNYFHHIIVISITCLEI